MYKAYLDDVCILNPPRNILVEDPTLELADNSAGSFSFTIYADNPGYEKIEALKSIISVYQDEEMLFRGRVIHTEKEDIALHVEAEGELAYLADTIQPMHEFHDISVRGYLDYLLGVHNESVEEEKRFETGAVTVKDSNDSLYRYTNFESTLDVILSDLIESLGGHLQIRYQDGKRYLDYLEDSPRTSQQTIEFGKNLLSYTESKSAYELATVCIPLGAPLEESSVPALNERLTISSVNSGKNHLELAEAIKNYGWICKVVTFDDVHVPENLKSKGEKWLKDNQYEELELSLSAVDLADFGIESDHLRLLDRIRCKSKPHGMDRDFPLLEMQIHLLDPELNIYTLGSKTKTFTSSTSRAQSSFEAFQKDTPTSNALLAQAKSNAQQLLNAFARNGYVYITENEIYILDIPVTGEEDLPQAKNVWRWNMGGLAFSKNGYLGPYEAAMTMDGTIMGNMLAAGTVAADKINIGYTKQIQEWVGENHYTKAEVRTEIKNTADEINLEVSKKVGTNEIINRINMSTEGIKINASKFDIDADAIRIRASKLSWTSIYSSMTEDGTLTCRNANVRGSFKCGTDTGYWSALDTQGKLTGGFGSQTYGYIDFSGEAYNVNRPSEIWYGIQIQGQMLRINTDMIQIINSSNVQAETQGAFTGQVQMIYRIGSGTFSWEDCRSNTLKFINGICVLCPSS